MHIATVGALLLMAAPAAAQSAASTEPPAPQVLAARIDSVMHRLQLFGVSGVLVVADSTGLLLHRAFGSVTPTGGQALTTSTRFSIGSLGKQFTAAAVLRLVGDGRLSVHDSLARFFPDAPADKRGITVHQLLTHTSGLPYLAPVLREEGDRRDVMSDMLALQLQAEPGSRYAYSNPGYTLLAGVIERASGQRFEEYLEQQLFRPAGMMETGFMGDTAAGHGRLETPSFSDDNDETGLLRRPLAWAVGAGTVVSTSGDMYRWAAALQQNTVLDAEATRLMFTGHVQAQGAARYGYGWNVVTTPRNTTLIGHAGDLGGFNADMRFYVEEGVTLIFLSNRRVGGTGMRQPVTAAVNTLLFGGPGVLPPAVETWTAAQMRALEGQYAVDGGRVTVAAAGGTFRISAEHQPALAALTTMDSTAARLAGETNDRAEAVLRAVAAGDRGPLLDLLMPALPRDQVEAGVLQTWSEHRSRLGELVNIEVTGTAVFSPAVQRTWYRLNFTGGSTTGMIGWGNGRITSLSDDAPPFAVTAAPVGPQRLAVYDPFSGLSYDIDVTLAGDGSAAALRLGTVLATRVP